MALPRREFLRGAGSAAALSWLPAAAAQTPRPNIQVLPIEFGSDKMVFADWWFVDAGYGLAFTEAQQAANHFRPAFMPYGVRLRAGKPRLSERAVLVPDTPTDGVTMGGYCTLLKDGGKYRLWYESYLPSARGDEDARICYAESEDGFTWKKPQLGLIDYEGSKANNLVYQNGHGATIFIDPTAQAAERYKLIHLDRVPLQMVNGKQMNAFVFGAVSPDGIHWKRLGEPLSGTRAIRNRCATTIRCCGSMWLTCAGGFRRRARVMGGGAWWCGPSRRSLAIFRSRRWYWGWARKIRRMRMCTRMRTSVGRERRMRT